MKILTFILGLLSLATISCNNKTQKNSVEISENVTSITSIGNNNIIGTWKPIGYDFTMDGTKTPTKKWVYYGKKDEAAVLEQGISLDAGNYTFKSNGTGYFGEKETPDGKFIYKELANGKFEVKGVGDENLIENTNDNNINVCYVDSNGQMIKHNSYESLTLGKKVVNNTFELFKKI